MLIPINSPKPDESLPQWKKNAINDLFRICNSKMYPSEKGYYQKLVDMLIELDYYRFNKSIFLI